MSSSPLIIRTCGYDESNGSSRLNTYALSKETSADVKTEREQKEDRGKKENTEIRIDERSQVNEYEK